MFPAHFRYHIEIKNLKFITEEGVQHPKTAILRLELPGQDKEIVELLGYTPPEEIYRLIDEKKNINLDYCYINKFSLSEYRQILALDKKRLVEIHDFTARHAFFDAHLPLDFTYAIFKGNCFSLENSHVARGTLSFNSSHFMTSEGVNMGYVRFNTPAFDFSNVRIGGGELSFKNSVFSDGKKDFQYTDFGTGKKLFTNTEFGNGDVSFINTVFNHGDVSFKIARFGKGRIDFHYSRFGSGDKTFERAEFGEGDVDFRTVEFGTGRVNFNRSRFGAGDILFEGSELNDGKFSMKRAVTGPGVLSFEQAEMTGTDLNLDRSIFGRGTLSFFNGSFGNISLISCHLDYYTDLRVRTCNQIDLSNTIVRDIIDLKPYEIDQNIRLIRFGGMRLIGRIYIDWKKNRVLDAIANQRDAEDILKAEQFRTLKENFNICGQYNDEDAAYIHFKRHEARALLRDALQQKPLNALWAGPAYLFKYLVFDKAGHYATNPARVILTMMISYILFSLLYVLLMITGAGEIIESVDHGSSINVLGRGFYHSAITFLTIGYGDYYPSGAIRWLSGIEGFTGVFLMSYFTVAFVRKILR